MSIGTERTEVLKRRAERKNWTVKKLREELTSLKIGYMSNWTKPVLLRRLEEHDIILDKAANQLDAMQSFEDQMSALETMAETLLEKITIKTEEKNALARERAEVLTRLAKVKAVVELTKPSFSK